MNKKSVKKQTVMVKKKMQHNLSRYAFFILLYFSSSISSAAKLDLYFGAFDFSAETTSTSGSKSGAGAYKISYFLPILEQLEVGIGYTVILSEIVSGDSSFGLDLEAAYFPLTSASSIKSQNESTVVIIDSAWSPFILLGYSARQFQSVSTQYNGFTAGIGTERRWNNKMSLKGLVRFASFAGPNDSSADELVILGGVSFPF